MSSQNTFTGRGRGGGGGGGGGCGRDRGFAQGCVHVTGHSVGVDSEEKFLEAFEPTNAACIRTPVLSPEGSSNFLRKFPRSSASPYVVAFQLNSIILFRSVLKIFVVHRR